MLVGTQSGRRPTQSIKEPRTPSPQLLALQPLYINLAWVLEQAGQHTGGAQAMITHLSERLATLSGAMTFSYLDNDDPQPGLREIEHLTSTTAACTPHRNTTLSPTH